MVPCSNVPGVPVFRAGARVPGWYHVPMFQVFQCSGLVPCSNVPEFQFQSSKVLTAFGKILKFFRTYGIIFPVMCKPIASVSSTQRSFVRLNTIRFRLHYVINHQTFSAELIFYFAIVRIRRCCGPVSAGCRGFCPTLLLVVSAELRR